MSTPSHVSHSTPFSTPLSNLLNLDSSPAGSIPLRRSALDHVLNRVEIGISIAALAVGLLALTGCSGSPGGALIGKGPVGRAATGTGADKKAPVTNALLSINDLWIATAKTCNGSQLGLDSSEGFRLDSARLVRIAQDTDATTDTQYCEDSFIYLRTPTQAATVSGVYTESATVASQANGMTKTCFRIQKKHVIRNNPASTVTGDFGPETFSTTLSVSATSLSLTLHEPTDCPSGDLILTLKKQR